MPDFPGSPCSVQRLSGGQESGNPRAEVKALREVGRFLWHGLGPSEHPVWPPFRRAPRRLPGLPVPRYLFAGFPAQAHPTRLGHVAPVAARSPVSLFAAWAFAFTPHVQARPLSPTPFLLFPLPLEGRKP